MNAEPGELHLDSIGQIHITVDDIDRAVAFYRDVLGMTPASSHCPRSARARHCGRRTADSTSAR